MSGEDSTAQAPPGCRISTELGEISIEAKASCRSLQFVVGLLMAVMWNGLMWSVLYIVWSDRGHWMPHGEEPSFFVKAVFVIFLLAGLYMILGVLTYVFGGVRVRIAGAQGEVFRGFWRIGVTDKFAVPLVTAVKLDDPYDARSKDVIVIEGRERVELGTMLSKESRQWMADELRKLLGPSIVAPRLTG